MVKKQINLIFDKRLSLQGQYNELVKEEEVGHRPNTAATKVDFTTFEELQPGEINHYKSHHI
jgi:hypothetical protein